MGYALCNRASRAPITHACVSGRGVWGANAGCCMAAAQPSSAAGASFSRWRTAAAGSSCWRARRWRTLWAVGPVAAAAAGPRDKMQNARALGLEDEQPQPRHHHQPSPAQRRLTKRLRRRRRGRLAPLYELYTLIFKKKTIISYELSALHLRPVPGVRR
jgi:hypothetical protein